MDTLGKPGLCRKELQDKAVPGEQEDLATLSWALGICVRCVLQPEHLPRAAPPHSLHSCSRSPILTALPLQQPTIHGGSCGMSLADKLYGNLSSWLALSLGVQCSCFRSILARQATLQREAERVFWSGLLLGAPLYFAQPHRVWFVVVSMEGGFVVCLWRCISSPSQQHLAQG